MLNETERYRHTTDGLIGVKSPPKLKYANGKFDRSGNTNARLKMAKCSLRHS